MNQATSESFATFYSFASHRNRYSGDLRCSGRAAMCKRLNTQWPSCHENTTIQSLTTRRIWLAWVIWCMVVLPSDMAIFSFFFQAEDGIRDLTVTGVQMCALPICSLGAAVAGSAARLQTRRVASAPNELAL